MAGAGGSLEDRAELGDLHRGLKSRRVHFLRPRREEQVDAGLLGEVHVAVEVSRIARQVLVGPELSWVDEEAGHRHIALAGTGPK